MRSLIILTGHRDWIVTKLLPSLYKYGYEGDVLVINYNDFSEADQLEIFLRYEDHVKFFDAEKKLSTFTADRFRAFSLALRPIYQEYDTVMHVDGSDIEFFGSITPMLQIASQVICTIAEPRNNDNQICKNWITANSIPVDYWSRIGPRPVLNCGVFAGPSEQIYQLCSIIAKFSEHDSRFGIDQLLFNALFYYYRVPTYVLGPEWDTHYYDGDHYNFEDFCLHSAKPITKEGKPIIIMHYAGPQPFKKSGDRGQKRKRNYLFGDKA